MNCSFCGKSQGQVAVIVIKKQGSNLTICNECIGLCVDVVFNSLNKTYNENKELANLVTLMEVGE